MTRPKTEAQARRYSGVRQVLNYAVATGHGMPWAQMRVGAGVVLDLGPDKKLKEDTVDKYLRDATVLSGWMRRVPHSHDYEATAEARALRAARRASGTARLRRIGADLAAAGAGRAGRQGRRRRAGRG
jgi:hypothetical protein